MWAYFKAFSTKLCAGTVNSFVWLWWCIGWIFTAVTVVLYLGKCLSDFRVFFGYLVSAQPFHCNLIVKAWGSTGTFQNVCILKSVLINVRKNKGDIWLDRTKWLQHLTAKGEVASVQVSIPASSETRSHRWSVKWSILTKIRLDVVITALQ